MRFGFTWHKSRWSSLRLLAWINIIKYLHPESHMNFTRITAVLAECTAMSVTRTNTKRVSKPCLIFAISCIFTGTSNLRPVFSEDPNPQELATANRLDIIEYDVNAGHVRAQQILRLAKQDRATHRDLEYAYAQLMLGNTRQAIKKLLATDTDSDCAELTADVLCYAASSVDDLTAC